MEAPNLNHLWTMLIIEELIRNGVRDFIIAPGARNAPLTIAALRNPKANTYTHFDERGAAFMALGHGRMGRPAAVICTSGSAVANCFPAVVESFQAALPLMILSADRPPELHQCGANQTMNQHACFGTFIRHFTVLPCPDSDIKPETLLARIDAACAAGEQGPVHINCMFREPLAPEPVPHSWPADYLAGLSAWEKTPMPLTTWVNTPRRLGEDQLRELHASLTGARHGVLLIGRLYSAKDREAALSLATHLGWPVFADITSGCRNYEVLPNLVSCYDLLLESQAFRTWCVPDCVLHIGDVLVSKRLQDHLTQLRMQYCQLTDRMDNRDSIYCVTRRYQADIAAACDQLARKTIEPMPTVILQQYQRANTNVLKTLSSSTPLEQALNELVIARTIHEKATGDTLLYLGNSMPVRDMDITAFRCKPTTVHANRGVSGIDGSIATAAGMAMASGSRTIAIIGDTAALHDLNSMAVLPHLPVPMLLVIINNQGGGIFSFLPVAHHADVLEPGFINPHPYRFKAAAEMFTVPYCRVKDFMHLDSVLEEALSAQSSMVLEIAVDRNENVTAHQQLRTRIASITDLCFRDAP